MSSQRVLVGPEIHYAIEAHYRAEVRNLQSGRYREWLKEMVAEDVHYWMPIWEQRFSKDKRPDPTPNDAAIYNDDYGELEQRVERLYTGMVWMEDPPSKIRYFITNVEAFDAGNDEFEVFSNVLVYRNRRQHEVSVHTLAREDMLRKTATGFRVFKRKLLLDARVTQDKNLYFFC
jgi:3-phenylpropionate/cinnamic acid dioxygenase small subunit